MKEPILRLFDEATGDVYKTSRSIADEALKALNLELSKNGYITLHEYKNILKEFFNCKSLYQRLELDDAVGFIKVEDQTFQITEPAFLNPEELVAELICLRMATYEPIE